MPPRPVNAILAILLSLMPIPALKFLDHLNRNCGDGLCGFGSGLLVLGTLIAATLVFVSRSARRNETPTALRLMPIAFWMLPLSLLV